MKKFVLIFSILVFGQCQRQSFRLNNGAKIVQEGLIDCFESGLKSGSYDVWCEASAVLNNGQRLYIANDKEMPDRRSSVFTVSNTDFGGVQYLTDSVLKAAVKYEDFALTPDRKFVFLTTAFDRIKPDSHDWDGYNSLIYWNLSSNSPKILKEGQERFSVSFRKKIQEALNNSPYFKIEGLAVTETHILVGIREEGQKFDNFSYKTKILAASYRIDKEHVTINGAFETWADIKPETLNPSLAKPLGLSSIEYDAEHKVFWLLTSFESTTQLNGGYLWWATADDLKNNKLNLVTKADGQPLHFSHKAEDLTLLGKNRLFVIHDDDRHKTKVGDQTRQPHQAVYSIVQF